MKLEERITQNPEICHGQPCIRGLRYPVTMLLELMASGMSRAEILEDYEDMEKEDLDACLLYASKLGQVKKMVEIAG